jgi:hypothetical protein
MSGGFVDVMELNQMRVIALRSRANVFLLTSFSLVASIFKHILKKVIFDLFSTFMSHSRKDHVLEIKF